MYIVHKCDTSVRCICASTLKTTESETVRAADSMLYSLVRRFANKDVPVYCN